MQYPAYTVLMSLYAKERPEYLKESIDSMLAQTVPPTGETDGREVPGGGAGETAGGAGPAAGQPGVGPTTDPAVKPAATSPKTNITTKTTVTASSKPKTAAATAATLPKTADNNWIAASVTLFLLGIVSLATACRC